MGNKIRLHQIKLLGKLLKLLSSSIFNNIRGLALLGKCILHFIPSSVQALRFWVRACVCKSLRDCASGESWESRGGRHGAFFFLFFPQLTGELKTVLPDFEWETCNQARLCPIHKISTERHLNKVHLATPGRGWLTTGGEGRVPPVTPC